MSIYKGSQLISGAIPNSANQSLSNLDSTGQAVIDGKVSKSGDTMTGDLNLSDAKCSQINSDITFGTLPSERKFKRIIEQYDSNNNSIGFVETSYNTTGVLQTSLVSHHPTQNIWANVNVGFDANGNRFCTFPNTTCVDGQWVSKWASVFNGIKAIGANGYSISSYLPNDGYAYEVLANMQMNDDGTTSGVDCVAAVGNVANPADTNCFRLWGNSDKGIWKPRFNGILVFTGSQRTVYYQIKERALQVGLALYFFGYRRIGTNS